MLGFKELYRCRNIYTTRKYRSRTFVPTGHEMDAVRKSKLVFGNKMDKIQLSSHSSFATSTPKNDTSVPSSAHSDAMKSSLLMDSSNSVSAPYDMSLIDMDFSNYPAKLLLQMKQVGDKNGGTEANG
ncbi:hypothetical protein OIU77_005083 [Salix suchowensis]|uniref:Uncharacterized protein n=2 Tax=Salix TaxID=40685 RepID=A0ABQ9AN45_9ROSI|nr:hypothetical protein OIU77_005083 [Salix suchowensis]